MKIPRGDVSGWCNDMANRCNISVPRRVNDAILWRSYFLDGSSPGRQALFNKVGVHIDTLASELYSPSDLRFWLARTRHADAGIEPILEEASNVLTDHFQDNHISQTIANALPWSLALGKTFIKMDWHGGSIKPYIVMPYELGVYREDYEGLDDQEAICQTFFLSMDEFRRMVKGHEREASILKRVEGKVGGTNLDETEQGYHRIFMGGTQPIITQGSPQPAGFASLRPNAPMSEVAPEVASEIIKFHELWVWDDELDDWTTFQFVNGGIMVEGELQRRNLFLPHMLPFGEICPNPVPGSFWGLSEIAPIRKLQDALNDRIADVLYLQELQIKRPRAMIGFEGLTDEKMAATRKPYGMITESNFQAKVEDLAPKVDGDVFASIEQLIGMFDKIAGLTDAIQGGGTPGVRSQGHAESVVRQSTPRLRDRALLIESQVAELGSLAFQIIQHKDPTLHKAANGAEFYLKSLEDTDFNVTIDAHSSSPVFVRDSLQLAVLLKNEGAIDNEDFLRLTHPPLFTTLIVRLRQREAARQKFLEEHPELAVEGSGGHKKKPTLPV